MLDGGIVQRVASTELNYIVISNKCWMEGSFKKQQEPNYFIISQMLDGRIVHGAAST